MIRVLPRLLIVSAAAAVAPLGLAQSVHLRLGFPEAVERPVPPAVVWLMPLQPAAPLQFPPHKSYTLMQKNRTFVPHLLVVPVGSQVLFPNEDPFFHNVFSLFDGKRFDLGLYEAGSTKSVSFSREGVSYIFCNIHPEMSAVVIALSTPLYATADTSGSVDIHDVPAGNYELYAWVEGIPQQVLDKLTRHIHAGPGTDDLGILTIPVAPARRANHLNKFGHAYDQGSKSPY